MKRFLFLVASICILAACSGFEQIEPQISNQEEDLIEKVVFEVLPIKDGDDVETRASAIPSANNKVAFGWEITDTVAIFPNSGSQVYFTIDESNVGKSTASFDGGGWALKPSHAYTSYYPFVGDIYLKRNKVPVSFTGQKQIGTVGPFNGARYFLAANPTTAENGVLRFSYNTLNTIINVNATLPAGTYTKASLTVSDPLFVEEGTYSLDDQTIVGTKYSTMLKMDLEDVTLTQDGVLPIYFMSAPVNLKDKEVTVKVISSDGKKYECVKVPSKAYEAGTRYGLTCDNMQLSSESNIVFADANIKAALVSALDTDDDGELSYMEAAAVTYIKHVFETEKNYTSFDEFQYFTGVSTIPANMFEGWQIASIILPESVSSIGQNAFKDCEKLISIDIPSSVNSIGYGVFYGCSRLSSITIPESVTNIGDAAFFNCSSLTSISIPESVTSIGYNAFQGCSSLMSITIPNSVTSIGDAAFSGCSSLTNIDIPESVTSIGSSAFSNCTNLTSISIPGSVTSIANRAFQGCSSLASISIPESATSIGYEAFLECSSLTSITIPESVTSIGNSAFSYCSSLTSITIPESVTSIGNSAFSYCSSLTSITIPEDVYKIENSTFFKCSGLTSISIPGSVTSIGNWAFVDCSSLTNITIPESVTSIGKYAFSGCTSLMSITIPESVTSIGESTFTGCSSLTNIVMSESVMSIGLGAFAYCSSLTSITIPESVTSIGDSAFQGCSSLTSISLSEAVTSIGSGAFYGCFSLNSIICLANTPPSGVSSSTFYKTNGCGIYVPAGSVNAYKTADGWSRYAARIYSTEGGYVPPVGDGGDD